MSASMGEKYISIASHCTPYYLGSKIINIESTQVLETDCQMLLYIGEVNASCPNTSIIDTPILIIILPI